MIVKELTLEVLAAEAKEADESGTQLALDAKRDASTSKVIDVAINGTAGDKGKQTCIQNIVYRLTKYKYCLQILAESKVIDVATNGTAVDKGKQTYKILYTNLQNTNTAYKYLLQTKDKLLYTNIQILFYLIFFFPG